MIIRLTFPSNNLLEPDFKFSLMCYTIRISNMLFFERMVYY